MGLLSALQTVVHSAKQIPASINRTTHEDDPEFVYERIPSLPYDGQITPDGRDWHMNFGGGYGDQPVEERHHVSNRPNTLGKVLSAVPGLLRAGIAGAAHPNAAGGGAADIFGAAVAGGHDWDERQIRSQQQARQKEQDEYRRKLQQSQIEENEALAQQRRAKADAPAAKQKAYAVGSFGYYDTENTFHPAPDKVDPKAETAEQARNFRISNAGGYALPEARTDQISIDPKNSVIGALGPRKIDVKVLAPEGYHDLPGTSGDERIVMPSAETKGDLRHPDKPTPVKYIQSKDGTMTAVRLDADGNPEEVPIAAKGMGQRPTNPRATVQKKSVTDQVAERTRIADQNGLTGDKREQWIMNGRISAAKKSGADITPEAIAAMFGGDAPPANPRATPGQKSSPANSGAALPPEIAAKLQVGKNTRISAPDGSLQMWVKNADGTVKRLR